MDSDDEGTQPKPASEVVQLPRQIEAMHAVSQKIEQEKEQESDADLDTNVGNEGELDSNVLDEVEEETEEEEVEEVEIFDEEEREDFEAELALPAQLPKFKIFPNVLEQPRAAKSIEEVCRQSVASALFYR